MRPHGVEMTTFFRAAKLLHYYFKNEIKILKYVVLVDNQWVMTKACYLTAMGVIERMVLKLLLFKRLFVSLHGLIIKIP